MDESNFVTLIKESKIEKRVKELARELDKLYLDESLVLVCVLKGAIKFYAALLQNIKNKNVGIRHCRLHLYRLLSNRRKSLLLNNVQL